MLKIKDYILLCDIHTYLEQHREKCSPADENLLDDLIDGLDKILCKLRKEG